VRPTPQLERARALRALRLEEELSAGGAVEALRAQHRSAQRDSFQGAAGIGRLPIRSEAIPIDARSCLVPNLR